MQGQHIAGGGPGDGLGQPARTRRNLMLCREGRQGSQQTKDQGKQAHGQAAFGSTNIRPRISMCSAWQNHWQ